MTVEQGLKKLAELLEEIRDVLVDVRSELHEQSKQLDGISNDLNVLEPPERLSETGDPAEILAKLEVKGSVFQIPEPRDDSGWYYSFMGKTCGPYPTEEHTRLMLESHKTRRA